ncbi:MAG: hypothetical protein Q7U60_02925 [Candidatus Methanoperedens sp.]|nr:hypothetical protein [Candidatus Methanoperedens sp.]
MEGEKTPYNNPVFKYGEYWTDVNRHTWMMILGCMMPLVLLGILWFA